MGEACRYLSDPGERRRRAGAAAASTFLHEHTYAARARTVLNFLHDVISGAALVYRSGGVARGVRPR